MVTVTIHTIHTPFTEVHVAREAFIFTQVFIPYTAAMTCCARAGHRRSIGEYMAVEEAAPYAGRLGYMAIATGSVTV
jgi:hypothetical protein